MSLKTFHIVFISVSTLLAFGFCIWALMSYAQGDHGMLIVAMGSFLSGVALIVYGIKFLRKLKHVSFL